MKHGKWRKRTTMATKTKVKTSLQHQVVSATEQSSSSTSASTLPEWSSICLKAVGVMHDDTDVQDDGTLSPTLPTSAGATFGLASGCFGMLLDRDEHPVCLVSEHSPKLMHHELKPATNLNALPNFTQPFSSPKNTWGSSVNDSLMHQEEVLRSTEEKENWRPQQQQGEQPSSTTTNFIASNEIMKKIFKIPYSHASVSITIHKVGESLILDGMLDDVLDPDEIMRLQRRQLDRSRIGIASKESEVERMRRRYKTRSHQQNIINFVARSKDGAANSVNKSIPTKNDEALRNVPNGSGFEKRQGILSKVQATAAKNSLAAKEPKRVVVEVVHDELIQCTRNDKSTGHESDWDKDKDKDKDEDEDELDTEEEGEGNVTDNLEADPETGEMFLVVYASKRNDPQQQRRRQDNASLSYAMWLYNKFIYHSISHAILMPSSLGATDATINTLMKKNQRLTRYDLQLCTPLRTTPLLLSSASSFNHEDAAVRASDQEAGAETETETGVGGSGTGSGTSGSESQDLGKPAFQQEGKEENLFQEEEDSDSDKDKDDVGGSEHERKPRSFRRIVQWQFNDLGLLLSSNTVVFQNAHQVGQMVSLALHDVKEQFTSLACLDLWLDNVMSKVEHAAVCFHKEGYVQGYQMIKTEDLPTQQLFYPQSTTTRTTTTTTSLETSSTLPCLNTKGNLLTNEVHAQVHNPHAPAIPHVHVQQQHFEPVAVMQKAHGILQFIQQHCVEEAGSYWLMRHPQEDRNLYLYRILRHEPVQLATPFDETLGALCFCIAEKIQGNASTNRSLLWSNPEKDRLRRCQRLYKRTLDLLAGSRHLNHVRMCMESCWQLGLSYVDPVHVLLSTFSYSSWFTNLFQHVVFDEERILLDSHHKDSLVALAEQQTRLGFSLCTATNVEIPSSSSTSTSTSSPPPPPLDDEMQMEEDFTQGLHYLLRCREIKQGWRRLKQEKPSSSSTSSSSLIMEHDDDELNAHIVSTKYGLALICLNNNQVGRAFYHALDVCQEDSKAVLQHSRELRILWGTIHLYLAANLTKDDVEAQSRIVQELFQSSDGLSDLTWKKKNSLPPWMYPSFRVRMQSTVDKGRCRRRRDVEVEEVEEVEGERGGGLFAMDVNDCLVVNTEEHLSVAIDYFVDSIKQTPLGNKGIFLSSQDMHALNELQRLGFQEALVALVYHCISQGSLFWNKALEQARKGLQLRCLGEQVVGVKGRRELSFLIHYVLLKQSAGKMASLKTISTTCLLKEECHSGMKRIREEGFQLVGDHHRASTMSHILEWHDQQEGLVKRIYRLWLDAEFTFASSLETVVKRCITPTSIMSGPRRRKEVASFLDQIHGSYERILHLAQQRVLTPWQEATVHYRIATFHVRSLTYGKLDDGSIAMDANIRQAQAQAQANKVHHHFHLCLNAIPDRADSLFLRILIRLEAAKLLKRDPLTFCELALEHLLLTHRLYEKVALLLGPAREEEKNRDDIESLGSQKALEKSFVNDAKKNDGKALGLFQLVEGLYPLVTLEITQCVKQLLQLYYRTPSFDTTNTNTNTTHTSKYEAYKQLYLFILTQPSHERRPATFLHEAWLKLHPPLSSSLDDDFVDV